MLDHALESAFVACLQSDPAFAGVYFFTGQDDEEHQLPAITVSAKSEPLTGSAEIFRADVSVMIESEAHDSRPDDHASLVEKVRSSLAAKATLIAAINGAGKIHLYGYAFTASTPDVDGTRFRTEFTLKAGYGVAAEN